MTAAEMLPVRPPRLPVEARARMALALRAGLGASLVVFLVALVAYLVGHRNAPWTSGEANPATRYLSLGGLASGLASGAPVAYLTLGLLLLVATPVLRVVTGVYYFSRDGERTIALIAFVVLLLLLVGLLVIGPLVR